MERIPLSGFSADFRRYGEFRVLSTWLHGDLANLSTCAKSQGGSLATKAAQIIPEIILGDAAGWGGVSVRQEVQSGYAAASGISL